MIRPAPSTPALIQMYALVTSPTKPLTMSYTMMLPERARAPDTVSAVPAMSRPRRTEAPFSSPWFLEPVPNPGECVLQLEAPYIPVLRLRSFCGRDGRDKDKRQYRQ